MSLYSRSLLTLTLALALGVGACKPDASAQGGAGGGMGAGMPPAPVSVVLPVQKMVDDWTDVTGQFDAASTVEIRPRVGGYLTGIHFKDGAIVKKGDLLFTIDKKPYIAALNEAKANLGVVQTQVSLAQRELDRAKDLVQTGDISQTLFDQRKQSFDAAVASVTAAKARVETAALDLQYTDVRAPLDGRISRSQVDLGNIVVGNSMSLPTLLTTVVSVDPIYLYFNIDEATYLKYARKVESAPKASVTIDNTVLVALADEPDYSHKGQMDFVDNALQQTSGTIRGRAVFDNPNGLLAPGLFGRARIIGNTQYQATLVPDKAIMTDQDHKLVLTVAADGTVMPKMVKPGALVDGMRVVEGLDGSEQVVVRGMQRAMPGSKVAPEVISPEAALQDVPAMGAPPAEEPKDKPAAATPKAKS